MAINKLSALNALLYLVVGFSCCRSIVSPSTWNIITTVLIGYGLFNDWPKRCSILAHTFPRDSKAVKFFTRFQLLMFKFSHYEKSVVCVFKKWVRQNPDKICILFEDKMWTYKQMDEYSNRVANLFRSRDYTKGDVVALLMDNRPEYIGIWLGLAKIGVITALINYNLRKQSLAHSINVSNAKAVIFSSEFTNALNEVKDSLDANAQYYVNGNAEETVLLKSLTSLIEGSSKADPPPMDIQETDRLIYIYTSGTTGLPKPAVISHMRYFFVTTCGHLGSNIDASDRFYVPLPLYHSAGGIIGAGQAIIFNATVALRSKFSASQFWDDCVRYHCTASQYIGETCRYLLAQPEKPQDSQHMVRVMIGNGLRMQMWDDFVSRFRIKDVVEFYGSTEGNANTANIDNTKGSVGFQPRVPSFMTPYMLIKVDKETGRPIRDRKGMCIQCSEGEIGELVGRIDPKRTDRHFEGYVNQSDSEKKIIRDVFTKGDKAFATGDLLVMDRYGYFYFKDRTGDTFRWKGENVSTAEVENVIGEIIGLKECVVYGVDVPGNEGKAGMLAIVDVDDSLDLNQFAGEIAESLPAYSRPVFVRLAKSLPMTSTFKLKKLELQEEGFDPTKCRSDPLYYLSAPGRYDVIDHNSYSNICSGKVRF